MIKKPYYLPYIPIYGTLTQVILRGILEMFKTTLVTIVPKKQKIVIFAGVLSSV